MHPALRAFRSKSFRIFYAGQGLSLIGNWMQTVAMSWLVYTASPARRFCSRDRGSAAVAHLVPVSGGGVWPIASIASDC